MPAAASPSMDINAVDSQITNLILTVGEDMTQPIASGAFVPNGSNNTVNVPMRLVGLTRGFIVKIVSTYTNTGTGTAALTEFGPANEISNFTLTDLDNYQRINTSGWHMNLLNTAKEGFPFGAALLSTAMDTPVAYGNNYSVISSPGTIAATTGSATVQMYYWVPCAYGKRDLRGALYRIGANPQFEPRDPNYHWFSGDGMVHGISLAGGKATGYRNRWVRTRRLAAEVGLEGVPAQLEVVAAGEIRGRVLVSTTLE